METRNKEKDNEEGVATGARQGARPQPTGPVNTTRNLVDRSVGAKVVRCLLLSRCWYEAASGATRITRIYHGRRLPRIDILKTMPLIPFSHSAAASLIEIEHAVPQQIATLFGYASTRRLRIK
ncbi:hypothetical protein E4U37_006733 [Claviceps purpurea]|nr:hypothetical protein E4U37_006733 [Claviceps purpurea]